LSLIHQNNKLQLIFNIIIGLAVAYIKNFFSIVLIISIIACSSDSHKSNNVVIGISSDIETLNPMFAFQANEATITELIFMSLVKHEWNSSTSMLEAKNMLAEEIIQNDDGSMNVKIRDDVVWSDSVKCTVDDIITSFDLYSDPDLNTRALGMFENFILDENGKVDIAKSFEKKSDTELKIFFKSGTNPTLLDIDHPILPSHILSSVERNILEKAEFNFTPVTNGPYKLKSWNKEQSIVLEANKDNFLINETSPSEIRFKIVPNYASLLLQLKAGEIHFIDDVKPEDADRLKENDDFVVKLSKGRQYDYLGWNNIDPESFANGKVLPNKYFGDYNVRRALALATNREEVLNNYLYDYGQLAAGPISSEFSAIVSDDIKPLDYNIDQAKNILSEAGWTDSNNNGILDKDGIELEFDIYIPSGEPRREFAANIFNNNFKELGINAEFKFVEMNTFLDGVFGKQFDSWMIGWTNPLPLNLRIQWYSNLDETPFNLPSYQNSEIDKLLDIIDSNSSDEEKIEAYKGINNILFDEQPVCFLYWIDGITVHSVNLENVTVDPFGSIQKCWEWKIK
jgi:peptide/nickel transport system substrate-binding protein